MDTSLNIDVLVIGAGPAGLMAAYSAAMLGAKVTVFEKNNRSGRKLRITGKGRCNVTNNCDRETFMANTPHGSRFMFSAFSALTSGVSVFFLVSAKAFSFCLLDFKILIASSNVID